MDTENYLTIGGNYYKFYLTFFKIYAIIYTEKMKGINKWVIEIFISI